MTTIHGTIVMQWREEENGQHELRTHALDFDEKESGLFILVSGDLLTLHTRDGQILELDVRITRKP